MGDLDRILTVVVSSLVSAGITLSVVSIGKADCEKDLPRTQECKLQWVKPEAGK